MKIKIYVGVALVIFIFVFGNIIAFGLLGSKSNIDKENLLNYSNENNGSLSNKDKINITNDNPPTEKPAINNTPTPPAPKPKSSPPPVTRAS